MRRVQWPTNGDRAAFRRGLTRRILLGCVLAATSVAAVYVLAPRATLPATPIALGMLACWSLWAFSSAQSRAQRLEITRSFAGLSVLHAGHALRVDRTPHLGSFPHRRDAVHAALTHGRWAVIVKAYGRYHVMSARLDEVSPLARPLSFRNPAVADVVPSVVGSDARSA